jgi:hypothetical protein
MKLIARHASEARKPSSFEDRSCGDTDEMQSKMSCRELQIIGTRKGVQNVANRYVSKLATFTMEAPSILTAEGSAAVVVLTLSW